MDIDFARTAADYLALRRRLGHKLADAERVLDRFVVFLDFVGVEAVTLDVALEFILDPDLDPASSNPARRLQAVRGFTRYLSGIDPATEIPPAGIVSYRPARRQPYLFTDADIDTDIDTAVITIRATKFNKSRQVPVTAGTVTALGTCMTVRDKWLPSRSCPNVFVSRDGTPAAYSSFGLTFRRTIETTGIGADHPTRPRVHDLRHRFAVRTLIAWHRAGLDVAAMLPRLSTYLGHREPRYTYRYLTGTPELLAHAAALLESDQRTEVAS